MDYTIKQAWNLLIKNGIATEEELQLVTDINGYSIDALNDIIYARTGYRNITQLTNEM